jgi:hypothetical protein
VQVGLFTYTSSYLIQGLLGNAYNDPFFATVMFMGSLHFSDASNSIDLKGSSSFICKSSAQPAGSNNLSVNATVTMLSGAGTGTFRGQSAIATGKMLITGKSTWIINF